MNLDRVYSRSPVWMQNMFCSAYGLRLVRTRYGSDYKEIEKQVFARDTMSADEMHHFKSARLRGIVERAAEQVPYYRRLFRTIGLDPRSIRSIEDLAQIPVLSKRQVQERIADFCSDDRSRMRIHMAHTSGTTGTGLVFPMTIQAEQEQWAVWWRYRLRFGIDRSTWYAHFYGRGVVSPSQTRPPFWRVNRPGRQILFSGYHMSDRFLPYYIEELNRCRPPWIQGYPSLLSLLAGYIETSGNALAYRPRIVTIGAESLLPHQKQLIERVFGAPCRQHYGTTEAVANISECVEGRLHVDEDFSCVEFVPDPSGAMQIVGTGFCNQAFVLLRYQVGDSVTLPSSQGACPCGNIGRTVGAIDGRIEDYVVTPDGRRIGRLDHILKDMVNVRECQILQEEIGRIEFRVVRGPRFTDADRKTLLDEARKRLGDDMRIEVSYVDDLQRSKTGKLRFVLSKIADARILPQVKGS